jgi:succinate dehydrogenase/fumarate reductase flavoprotein subunit
MGAARVFDHEEFDVLAVGGGPTGTRASIAAADAGVHTGMLLKGVPPSHDGLGHGVQVLAQTTALEILRKDRDHAAAVVAIRSEKLILIRARAIVLATGGAGRIYPLTSESSEATGDGYAMALRNGAALSGMESVQFALAALAYPEALAGTRIPDPLLGLPATRLWNARNERFMEKYDRANTEGAGRNTLARAIHSEVVEGRGSPHGGVYLDLTRNDPATLERLAGELIGRLEAYGIDPRHQPIEIAPAAECFIGGIEIDARAQTAMPALYAAGEAAAEAQPADATALGTTAGEEAASYARAHPAFAEWDAIEEMARIELDPFHNPDDDDHARIRLDEVHTALQQTMFADAGIVREPGSLERGLVEIARLRGDFDALTPLGTHDLKRCYEVRNMLDAAEAVTRSAMHHESRGPDNRYDRAKGDRGPRFATRVFGRPGRLQVEGRRRAKDPG